MTKSKRSGPYTIALAGAGMISWFHLVGWRNLGDRVRLVAVSDPNRPQAQKRADEFGIAKVYEDRDAMLAGEEIDALDVASPRETHAAWVEAAMAKGIDVICQKPLTPTLAEAEALVRRAAGISTASGARLMIHENWRFRPWYRVLKSWIAAGALGEIIHARLSMINSGFLPDAKGVRAALVRQPFMQHERRLMISETLIHHLDTMRFLCGDLRLIAARMANTLPDIAGETTAAMFLETASGAAVEVMGTMAAAGYPPRLPDRLEIIGGKASVVFEDSTLRLLGPEPRTETFDNDRGYQASFDGVIKHFVDCLDSGAAFETGPEDNLQTLRLVEHAYWAAGRHGVK
jgi:predicted dehydrogenase